MDSRNETSLRNYRFLNETYFARLYDAFILAFSDYVIPFVLTEAQFRNHIILNAVDLSSTIGCVESDKLVGFSLNGFGKWNEKSTVYDAGTGVIPEFRRQGISGKMFDLMLPIFKEQGIEQFLLEVVTNNNPAVDLYEKLGFHKTRELALLQCEGKVKSLGSKKTDFAGPFGMATHPGRTRSRPFREAERRKKHSELLSMENVPGISFFPLILAASRSLRSTKNTGIWASRRPCWSQCRQRRLATTRRR